MPSYNYYCSSCDLVFSDLVPMSKASEPQDCEKCGTPSDRTAQGQKIIKSEKGVSPYTEYKINHDVALEQGLCKKITDQEKKARDDDRGKAMKKLAEGMSENDINYTKVANSKRTH